MFRNVLVALDDSCHADRALNEAIDIALAANGRITLLTSVQDPSGWLCLNAGTYAAGQDLCVQLEEEAVALQRRAVEQIPESIPVVTLLTRKPIRTALVERVAEGHDDLVVLGSRGRRALAATLLGSVSHHALHHCPVPVLVIHSDESARASDVTDERTPAPAPTTMPAGLRRHRLA
jgi:nucleotide-binding universal stress UspA family protein